MVSFGACTFWPPLVSWSSATHALFNPVQRCFFYVKSQSNFTSDLSLFYVIFIYFSFNSKPTQTSQLIFAPAFSGPHSDCISLLLVTIERHKSSHQMPHFCCVEPGPWKLQNRWLWKVKSFDNATLFPAILRGTAWKREKSWLILLQRVFSHVFVQHRTNNCDGRLLCSCSSVPKSHDWTCFVVLLHPAFSFLHSKLLRNKMSCALWRDMHIAAFSVVYACTRMQRSNQSCALPVCSFKGTLWVSSLSTWQINTPPQDPNTFTKKLWTPSAPNHVYMFLGERGRWGQG